MNTNPEITIHTLGPKGTNCEKAAIYWCKKKAFTSYKIILYDSLENAIKNVSSKKDFLLSCIVYPDLHTLVFGSMNTHIFYECFVIDTYSMVLAAKSYDKIKSISTHPAPQSLIQEQYSKIYVNSNAQAAIDCSNGKTDACITTDVCAKKENLIIVKDFGPVPMGFAIHKVKSIN